jgi:fatty-acyl-CoA synthase
MAQAYGRGPSNPPLKEQTLGAFIDSAAEKWRHREAIVGCDERTRLTYEGLSDQVRAIAGAYLSYGVGRGDRIAIWSKNCSEWIVAQAAAAKIGAILVAINPLFRSAELTQALRMTKPKVLIIGRHGTDPGTRRILEEARTADEVAGSIRQMISLGATVQPGLARWADCAARSATAPSVASSPFANDAAAMILFTSGTTGEPKGVVLSHGNVLNGGYFVGQRLRLTESDKVCLPVPLFHVLGCVAAVWAALTHGAAIVLPSERFDAGKCLSAISTEHCTAIVAVPSMFLAQLERPDFQDYDLKCLRTGVVSGAACSAELMARISTDMHLPEITVAYGMTEAAPILFTDIHDSLAIRSTCAGVVQPHVECQIVDVDTREVVSHGERGELRARGYCVMKGYWNDQHATAQVVDQSGWMHTGDLAEMRSDGYVSIVGRVKDLVIRGGENISPLEIERVLSNHPSVAEACVVGVPDREYGEELCAFVRLGSASGSVEELRRHCRTHLAPHKIPKHVLFTSTFPTTPSGKIQKWRLRQEALTQIRDANVQGPQ